MKSYLAPDRCGSFFALLIKIFEMASWQVFRFQIESPKIRNPHWWIDILLLDTVVRSCVAKYGREFLLWRIHRRAAEDKTGHQFSFYCYVDDAKTSEITAFVESQKAIEIIQTHGLLRGFSSDIIGEEIEAASDRNWTDPVQKTWPYFIMGVSEMLLHLLDEVRQAPTPSLIESDKSMLQRYYTDLHERVNEVWLHQGSHCFLHHLGALFAYKPIVVVTRF